MTVSPLIAALGALGGYIAYDKLSNAKAEAAQPAAQQKEPFWNSWFQQGNQPATGNGRPTTDVSSVSNAIGDVAKFGVSLVEYFGTSKSSGNDYGGGIGASSTQTESYGGGYRLTDDDMGWSNPF
jgi:hypothetical protein